MRKFYSLLIAALLLPVVAFAQNKAISVTQVNPYQCTDNMLEIPYVGLIEDQIPASKDICYSVGMWIKPSATLGTSGQFETAEGNCMGLLFGFGTSEHTNPGQWQFGLGYSSDGAIQIIGDGGLGAGSNGFAPNPAAMVGTLSLEDWSYVVFTIDNVNRKAALYVNGELAREGELAAPGMYWTGADNREGDDGKWPTFQWFSYRAQGALDEVQFFNKALTAGEVKDAMASAYAVSGSLIGLYNLDEQKSDGVYANVAPGGKDVNAEYKQVVYTNYWGGSAMVYRKYGTVKAPTEIDGRTIEKKEVTLTIPETNGGKVELTADADASVLTAGEYKVMTQSIYTINATAADGYAMRNLFTNINGVDVKVANGSKLVVVADTKVYGDFTNDLNALTVNCGDGAEYSITRNDNEADITKLINGEKYYMTITMADELKKLIDVKLNDEVLEAVDGVYSFVSAPNQTLTITTSDKPYYTVTIEQPEVGGTLTVMWGDKAVNSGEKVLESETITLVANPASETYVRSAYIVNGEKQNASEVTVLGDLTLSIEFLEGQGHCAPTPVEGRPAGTKTTRADRVVRSFDVTIGNNVTTVPGNTANPREVYLDNTAIVLEAEAGQTVTTNADAAGVWMHTVIWADFDFNGIDENDWVAGLLDNNNINMPCQREFIVPAIAKENSPILVRYMVDWSCTSPCTYGETSGDNGEFITDFYLLVKQPRIETTRTITIKSNDAQMGKVEFVNIDGEGSVTTNYKTVYVKTSLLAEDGVVFINWTDANGNVISTEPEFAYEGTEDIELTANYGYAVNYTFDGDCGTVVVTNNGTYVPTGSGVVAGSKVNVAVEPKAGYKVASITVNGEAVTENEFEITVNAAQNIEVTFAEASYELVLNVDGNGVVRVADDMDDVEMPGGNEYVNGATLTLGNELFVWLLPNGDETVISATAVSGENTIDYAAGDFEAMSEGNGFYGVITIAGSLEVNAKFSGTGAIDGIEADDANAPVEFYNLQGVRVNNENLTPGIYVRRQGAKTVKVYVGKK